MKKVLTVIGIVAVACLSGMVMAEEETFTLGACGEKKAAVTFPHTAHAGVTECQTCHHSNEGLTADSDQKVEKCSACHLNPEKAETPDCASMSATKNPYHIRCIGCHKTEAKGPTKCNDCHPKE